MIDPLGLAPVFPKQGWESVHKEKWHDYVIGMNASKQKYPTSSEILHVFV